MHCKSWHLQTSILLLQHLSAPRCCCLLLTLGSAAAVHMQASAPHLNARLHFGRGSQAERKKGLKGAVC